MDFFTTVTEVHPSLNDSTGVQSKSISNDTLSRLAKTVLVLKEDKKQRLHKLQELATQLMDLWNLMDTSPQKSEDCLTMLPVYISASVDEVTVPGALALDLIEQDENSYNASRGAHFNLKRAEKAQILVNKIPALVDTLVANTHAGEEDRGILFTYDGVPLLAMLDEYAMLRQEREEEKQRMRESKKYHEQQNTEQEAIFGSRQPSPACPSGTKKVVGPHANGGANGTPSRRLSLNQNGSRSAAKDGRRDSNIRPAAPVNYIAISKEDTASHVSGTGPVPASP